jgi:hypothetical protein
MPSERATTRTQLENSLYPAMQVSWTEDEDGNGYTGKAVYWADGNTIIPPEHEIHVRQSIPLGMIYTDVDGFDYGCWASTKFEGVTITERDLQWAAAWASEALKRKRERGL